VISPKRILTVWGKKEEEKNEEKKVGIRMETSTKNTDRKVGLGGT